jgi:hypothetical protein
MLFAPIQVLVGVVLFIWSIFILVSGKLQLARYYGIKGRVARILGVVYLLISLGFIGDRTPSVGQDSIQMLSSFCIKMVLIFIVTIVAASLHGNDFIGGKK